MKKRMYYVCSRCKCNYDAGELTGGICIDCIENDRKQSGHKESIARYGSQKMNFLTPLRARKQSIK